MPETLDDLAAAIGGCRICLDNPAGRPLPHQPRPVFVPSSTAKILIAGQAPGTRVHISGHPFDDASGDRLRAWMGVSRAEFYDSRLFAIAAIGFCFPGQDAKGGDLPPRRECAPVWRGRVMQSAQIELVLAIGAHAQSWHLGLPRGASLSQTVLNWRAVFEASCRPHVLPLPHPSWRNSGWLKRRPWFEADVLPFLRAEISSRINHSAKGSGAS